MATAEEVKMNELTECSLCIARFHRPKMLPCQHCFCFDCLDSLAGGRTSLKCPQCRRECLVPASGIAGFPDHFLMNNLLDIALGAGKCAKCHKAAEKTCSHCRTNFCLYCLLYHTVHVLGTMALAEKTNESVKSISPARKLKPTTTSKSKATKSTCTVMSKPTSTMTSNSTATKSTSTVTTPKHSSTMTSNATAAKSTSTFMASKHTSTMTSISTATKSTSTCMTSEHTSTMTSNSAATKSTSSVMTPIPVMTSKAPASYKYKYKYKYKSMNSE